MLLLASEYFYIVIGGAQTDLHYHQHILTTCTYGLCKLKMSGNKAGQLSYNHYSPSSSSVLMMQPNITKPTLKNVFTCQNSIFKWFPRVGETIDWSHHFLKTWSTDCCKRINTAWHSCAMLHGCALALQWKTRVEGLESLNLDSYSCALGFVCWTGSSIRQTNLAESSRPGTNTSRL